MSEHEEDVTQQSMKLSQFLSLMDNSLKKTRFSNDNVIIIHYWRGFELICNEILE